MLRLVALNASIEDAELTRDIQILRREAPSLFSRMLTDADSFQLKRYDEIDEGYELDPASTTSTDESHVDPILINSIPANKAHSLGLITRAGQVQGDFENCLRRSYERDYQFAPGEPVVFGNLPVQWAHKFTFTDRYVSPEMYCFSRAGPMWFSI